MAEILCVAGSLGRRMLIHMCCIGLFRRNTLILPMKHLNIGTEIAFSYKRYPSDRRVLLIGITLFTTMFLLGIKSYGG